MKKNNKEVTRKGNVVEAFLNENYEFKFNEVLNRTSFRSKNENAVYRIMQGYNFNSILREIKNAGICLSIQGLRSLLNSDFVPKYDPIKSYIKDLGDWDGKTDYIDELCSTISTTNDELFKWAFKKWFVAFVASCKEDKIINHCAFIITGKQGIGKTTWLLNLVPKELAEYKYSGKINPSNKDSNLLLTERILINIDELASYTKSQVEAYKELITKETISERRAYGFFTENYIRRASFVGSSNHNEILMDSSGNRRFLVFEAEKIKYNHDLDMNLVFSQALGLIKSGFRYYFDKDDSKRIEKNNEKYMQSSREAELIEQYFTIPIDRESKNLRVWNATEIISYLKRKTKVYMNINNVTIGKLMKAKGYPETKRKGSKKYIVEIL